MAREKTYQAKWFSTKFANSSRGRRIVVILVVFSVASLGVYTTLFSSAATVTSSYEAEVGTVNGPAATVSDTSASASSAVKFKSSSAGSAKLTWSPPSGYQSYTVKNAAVSTATQSISGAGGDIWVKLPASATGPITLTNCRNAVLIGGQINIPPNSGPGTDMRGIYINGCTGTIYIEGVLINGDISTAEGDGIAINAPSATVIVQNVRVEKLYGGYDTALHNHSDIIQPWGGVKTLQVDHLTGSTNYQGLQINVDTGPIETETFKNVNIGDSGVAPVDNKGGYYLWLSCGQGTAYSFSNVYIKPRVAYPSSGASARTLNSSIYDTNSDCGMSASSSTATFTSTDISGQVYAGTPPAGDFVPVGTAGLGYVSPGYQ